MEQNFFTGVWGNHQEFIVQSGKNILLSAVVLLLSWACCRAAKKIINKSSEKIELLDGSVSRIFYSVVRVFIWLPALLIILNIFGVNTAGIVTILGAAGLAICMAIKDSLSNIAAGLMLLIQRPYRSGDVIDCKECGGTIKMMGLFSTELETADGIFVIVPNSVIINSPVKNYSRNPFRRTDIPISIAYCDSLEVGINTLLTLMKQHASILDDPAPEVLVTDLTGNAIQLTLRYWTNNINYWSTYRQIKFQLKDSIENAGLTLSALPRNPIPPLTLK